jgi:hypothetical protein
MPLKEKLDNFRQQFESTAPADALTIMHSATEDLVQSEIMKGVLKEGNTTPTFSLPAHDGKLVSSS